MAKTRRFPGDRGEALFGALNIGAGTTVTKIKSGTIAIDPASIATLTKAGTAWTLTGVAAGDIVITEPPAALEDDLVPAGSVVTNANEVTQYLYNASAGAVDGISRTWRYLWIDLT